MTDAEIAALVRAARITDEQLQQLASGHIVLWMNEGVRRDERDACATIAEADTSFDALQDFGMQSHSAQLRTNIADAIRARGAKQE